LFCFIRYFLQPSSWWSPAERGGTASEVLALGLLVARTYDIDSSGVREWCAEVIADSPSYVDGELWKAPGSWRLAKRNSIAPPFKRCVQKQTLEVRSGVKTAMARWEGAGRVDCVPALSDLDSFLKELFSEKKDMLLGPGGPSISKGGCRRSTYLMPRVARFVHAHHVALQSALNDGTNESLDGSEARGAPPGKTIPSPFKAELKEIVKEQELVIETLSASAQAEKKLRQQAIRRRNEVKANIASAVERRTEKARADATVAASLAEDNARAAAAETVEAAARERDAAISRASLLEAQVRGLRQTVRGMKKRQSDPLALKRKDKEIRDLRAENHTLRVAASTHERDLTAARDCRRDVISRVGGTPHGLLPQLELGFEHGAKVFDRRRQVRDHLLQPRLLRRPARLAGDGATVLVLVLRRDHRGESALFE